jgi:hypothetical protein
MADGPIQFETDARFARMDGRDYIQGITILTRMLDAALNAAEAEGPIFVNRVKYTSLTLDDGTIRGTIGDSIPADTKGAVAFLSATLDGRPVQAAYFPNPARPVMTEAVSPPYPLSNFAPTEAHGATMTVDAPDGETFMWTLIEANKRTIAHWVQDRYTKPRIELVEATGFYYRRNAMTSPGQLTFTTLSTREFGDRLYILNEARYADAGGSPRSARLRYSVNEA